ncbi:hypothetical protein SELMODRAFT_71273, partial [Selaginella moellendorffii]
GRVETAFKLFDGMFEKNKVIWNTILHGFALNNHRTESLELFVKMVIEGFDPDEISFNSVLSACNHTGNTKLGLDYLISMEVDFGLKVMLEHFHCVMDLLGRVGRLDEIEQLFNCMPSAPNSITW